MKRLLFVLGAVVALVGGLELLRRKMDERDDQSATDLEEGDLLALYAEAPWLVQVRPEDLPYNVIVMPRRAS